MAPFRSRNTGFNVSSSSSFSSLPLPSSWDRSDSDSDSKKVREASEQALEKQSAISRLRRPSSSMAKSRLPKKRVIRDERRGWFSEERETRRLFRTEIGTTRSLRRSRTLECRYDEERTRHSSRIRPREEAKNRTEE